MRGDLFDICNMMPSTVQEAIERVAGTQSPMSR